jgi:uncharacterized surface protein with fasciclin (FAS1) repeats
MTIRFARLAGAAILLIAAGSFSAGHARPSPADAPRTAVGSAADLSIFIATIKAVGLTETLAKPGPFTVFAPNNAAFNKLPAGTVATLLKPENRTTLTTLLSYHVVPGALTAKDLRAAIAKGGGKASLDTLQGEPLTLSVAGDLIVLTDVKGGTSLLSDTDRPRANGVLHVIDTVLMP